MVPAVPVIPVAPVAPVAPVIPAAGAPPVASYVAAACGNAAQGPLRRCPQFLSSPRLSALR